MPATPTSIRRVRLEELARELGVLRIAITPIDMVLAAGQSGVARAFLIFIGIGIVSIEGAWRSEERRSRAAK